MTAQTTAPAPAAFLGGAAFVAALLVATAQPASGPWAAWPPGTFSMRRSGLTTRCPSSSRHLRAPPGTGNNGSIPADARSVN